ncbi:unnamed protein product, partial [Cyprideis torosa]
MIYIFVIATDGIKSEDIAPTSQTHVPSKKIFALIVLGSSCLFLGAKWVVDGAVHLATNIGMNETFIGLTILALGTSLPELVTAVKSALRKDTDIAVGNAIGSNIFNLLWILSISAVIRPLPFNVASNTDILMVIGSASLILVALIIGRSNTTMASGFFALLDDVATLMEDVAAMSKIATKKTAGILGDDLAVNAEKASGFIASREIPVLWAITKGSFLNKLIILPLAFLLSAFAPWVVTAILLIGAVYLAYEGAEKIYEFFVPHAHENTDVNMATLSKSEFLALEKEKIKAAVVTDFILSVEIVIIALGTVLTQPILTQIIVVSFIALIATVGVYGIVALIVRMDDIGLKLISLNDSEKSISNFIGNLLVNALPKVIKSLSVIGTIALLLVAGGEFIAGLIIGALALML